MLQESKKQNLMELKSILMQKKKTQNLLHGCLQNLGIYLSIRNCNLHLNRLILLSSSLSLKHTMHWIFIAQ